MRLLKRLMEEYFSKFVLSWMIIQCATKLGSGLIIEKDLPEFECLEGFAGVKAVTKELRPLLDECSFDKTQPVECQKHCLAKKLGLIVEGKIWLYKLAVTLKILFPGQVGKDSWDKMIDVILECTDKHYKAHGPLSQFHCYREKKMWQCVINSVEIVCQNNHRHRMEAQRNRDKNSRKHEDELVDDGETDREDAGLFRTEDDLRTKKGNKQMVLKDY